MLLSSYIEIKRTMGKIAASGHRNPISIYVYPQPPLLPQPPQLLQLLQLLQFLQLLQLPLPPPSLMPSLIPSLSP